MHQVLSWFNICTLCSIILQAGGILGHHINRRHDHQNIYNNDVKVDSSERVVSRQFDNSRMYTALVDEHACIIFNADAQIEIYFETKRGVEVIDIHNRFHNPLLSHERCDDENETSLTFQWGQSKEYTFYFSFDKTPAGERWYMSDFELTISTNGSRFKDLRNFGKQITLAHEAFQFFSPMEEMFVCDRETFYLKPRIFIVEAQKLINATVHLNNLQIQPFLRSPYERGPVHECPENVEARHRIISIGVGATLGIAFLVTVIAYVIIRFVRNRNSGVVK